VTDALLMLNAGSSSLKFRLLGRAADLPYLLGGKITDIGHRPVFQVHWQEDSRDETADLPAAWGIDATVAFALDWLSREARHVRIVATAHRIVHGGTRDRAEELTPATVTELDAYAPLAPQHQPHNLAAVKALWQSHPHMRQFGCFDTAFHAHLPSLATRFALPEDFTAKGLRRYGYHGLSYAWIAECLRRDYPGLAERRVVAAHLGNGASLCALDKCRSVDTTMGLTALDGLPMGTRCGSLDPGAVLYMQKSLGLTADQVETILYERSGLLGLSGMSNDVRTLLASQEQRARFALDYFAHRTAQHIAGMAVSLGGMDALVFTGGIGENAEAMRRMILDRLGVLAPFEVLVIPANEERAMATEVGALFGFA
jgi:acetate kinase